jgi:hypothetical protein
MNGSDYAGLPSSLPWPYQIVTAMDGKFKKTGETPGNQLLENFWPLG